MTPQGRQRLAANQCREIMARRGLMVSGPDNAVRLIFTTPSGLRLFVKSATRRTWLADSPDRTRTYPQIGWRFNLHAHSVSQAAQCDYFLLCCFQADDVLGDVFVVPSHDCGKTLNATEGMVRGRIVTFKNDWPALLDAEYRKMRAQAGGRA